MNILTVGVTTLPFAYEGPKNEEGFSWTEELKKHLDTTNSSSSKPKFI